MLIKLRSSRCSAGHLEGEIKKDVSFLTQLGKKVRFCGTTLDFSDLGYTTSLFLN